MSNSSFGFSTPLFPERPDFTDVWKQSINFDAKTDARVKALSGVFNTSPQTVKDNLADYEAYFASKQLYNDTVSRLYPTLHRNLTEVPFVAVARDDMDNIIETEGFWNEVGNGWNIGRDTAEIGRIGTRAMLDGRDLYPYERRKIRKRNELQRAHTQSDPGWFAAGAELAGTMVETAVPAVAAGLVTGAVYAPAAPYAAFATAYAMSFSIEAGNLYADLIMDGYTPSEATDIAASYGAVIAGFEAVGLKATGAAFRGFRKSLGKKLASKWLTKEGQTEAFKNAFRGFSTAVLGEATTEATQEVIGEHAKYRASYLYRPEKLYEPEYWEAGYHAFTHTFKGMVV